MKSHSIIHFVLVHSGTAKSPNRPQVIHFGVTEPSGDQPLTVTPVDLVVMDARRMRPACVTAAFKEVGRLRQATRFKHGVLVSNAPALPIVVEAMRAGLNDIIYEPLRARQLVKLLRAATPGHRVCRRQIKALSAIVRILDTFGQQTAGASLLARREYDLIQRADQINQQETRLALKLASIEEREQKLRTSTRQIGREFTALQNETLATRTATGRSAPPFARGQSSPPFSTEQSASPLVTELQVIADQLAERARALDIRERMLLEMESLFSGQSAWLRTSETGRLAPGVR